MQETWVQSLGREDPLEKGMAAHSSILAWRFPWTEKPGGLQSMGWPRVGHSWATNTFTSKEVIFKLRYFLKSGDKSISVKGNSMCEVSEAGTNLMCSRSRCVRLARLAGPQGYTLAQIQSSPIKKISAFPWHSMLHNERKPFFPGSWLPPSFPSLSFKYLFLASLKRTPPRFSKCLSLLLIIILAWLCLSHKVLFKKF